MSVSNQQQPQSRGMSLNEVQGQLTRLQTMLVNECEMLRVQNQQLVKMLEEAQKGGSKTAPKNVVNHPALAKPKALKKSVK